MGKPLLYDVFCGAGGASVGYSRAGFDVVGIDHAPQKNYPFEFIQMDAFEFFARVQRGEFPQPATWHCSPPCQAHSSLRALHRDRDYPDLIEQTREALIASGRPWVIENVPGAPLRDAVTLCGSMFGLGAHCRDGSFHQLRRHRLFECSEFLLAPLCNHKGRPVGVYGHGGGTEGRAWLPGINGFTGTASERRAAMGIDWMRREELSQAIPPAYTFWTGNQLMRAIGAEVAA